MDDIVRSTFITVTWASVMTADGKHVESGFVADEDQLAEALERNNTFCVCSDLCMN